MNFKNKFLRALCGCLAVILVIGGLSACAATSEVPDGYQYATCGGEYFRLFVPTQWTVNTESGISSAFLAARDARVSMVEVPFVTDDTKEEIPLEQFVAAHDAELANLSAYTREKTFNSTLAGYRAVDITYTATVGGEGFRFRQVMTCVVGRCYLFTYSAPTEKFDAYLNTVDEILENITFESAPFEGEDQRKIPENVEVPEGMKLISDNEVAYRFFAPESWIRDVRNGQNLVYVSEEDRSNVSMISYDYGVETAFSAEEYWKECKDRYVDALENFTVLSEEEILLKNGDNGEKKAMVYEYTYELGGVTYHVRQMICYVGMVYTMTYTALPEHYEAHLEDVLAMEQALYFRKMFD